MTSNVLLFYAYTDNRLDRWQEAVGLAVQHKNDIWGEIWDVDNKFLHIQFVSLIGNKLVSQSGKFEIKCFTDCFQDMDLPIALESFIENPEFRVLLELKVKELQDRKEQERLRLEAERRKRLEKARQEQANLEQQRKEQERLRLIKIDEERQERARREAEKQTLLWLRLLTLKNLSRFQRRKRIIQEMA